VAKWPLRCAGVGDVLGPGLTPQGRTPSGSPPPAWYRDPWSVAALRWWDGQSWTAFTSPGHIREERERPIAKPVSAVEPSKRCRLTIELVIVLAIFPFPYVVNALAVLIQAVVHEGTTGRFPLPITSHLGLSFLIDVLLALEPLAAAALALYLLSISGEGGARAVNLDRSDPRQDLALLLPVFLLCFLVPEFGVSLVLHAAHVRAITLTNQHLPGYYSVIGAANSLVAGVVEEIVVLGYLVRRLEQLGLRPTAVVAIALLVRISYHVYYGWGVLPIAAWALASLLVYRRYRRLGPFIAVHVLWDLALILVPFFGGWPVAIELVLLAPLTFVFWLMWRDRLARLSSAPRSGPEWRAR
jgi:membrane protease YdiL (CAAX protease family)